MTEPHRNDVGTCVALGPGHNNHALIEPTHGYSPDFAVVKPIIKKGFGLTGENLFRIDREVYPSLAKRPKPL